MLLNLNFSGIHSSTKNAQITQLEEMEIERIARESEEAHVREDEALWEEHCSETEEQE